MNNNQQFPCCWFAFAWYVDLIYNVTDLKHETLQIIEITKACENLYFLCK